MSELKALKAEAWRMESEIRSLDVELSELSSALFSARAESDADEDKRLCSLIDPKHSRRNTLCVHLAQMNNRILALEIAENNARHLEEERQRLIQQPPPVIQQPPVETRDHEHELELKRLELESREREAQAQCDHEREMKIIDHEIARENRLAAEATAKVAATAQEQASQSLDGLLKGLQGNGEG